MDNAGCDASKRYPYAGPPLKKVPHHQLVGRMTGIVIGFTCLASINAATVTGIVTIGVTLLMIAGEFDLSVGTMMAMGAFLFGLNSIEGGNPTLALLLALLVPALMGATNGIIVIRTRTKYLV